MSTERVEPLPIACSLGAEDGRERVHRWRKLAAAAQLDARHPNGSVQIRYRRSDGILVELLALVAAERLCCPFLGWRVEQLDSTVLTLEISAQPDAAGELDHLAELFGAHS